jgi:hypothetical protein
MTQPEPKKKGRGWYGWIIGFIGAFGLGFNLYSTQHPKEPSSAPIWDQATTAQARALQGKLGQIEQRPVVSIDDYIRKTVDAAPIIDEAKGLLPLQIASVERFKHQHASNDKDVMIAGYALRMFGKEQELMSLMGDEIYCTRALEALPVEKGAGYYDENVVPLKEKQKQAFAEWAAIAKEAQTKGVSWSDAVTDATKLSQ